MTLEARLRALADDAFPPTPHLAASWAAKPSTVVGLPAHGWRERRRWLPILVAALLVPAGAGAALLLRPEHITIVRVETLPPLPSTAPNLGDRVPSVAAASARAGFAVQALPGPARSIHVLGDLVTLTYDAVVITEVPARKEPDALVKTVGPGTTVQRVGPNGYFLSGAPHEVAYLSPDGRFVRLPPRLAGNTYALERDGLLIRIEGERLTLATARRLSRALARRGTP